MKGLYNVGRGDDYVHAMEAFKRKKGIASTPS